MLTLAEPLLSPVINSNLSVAAAPNWNQTVQAWYNEVDKVDPVIVPQFRFAVLLLG